VQNVEEDGQMRATSRALIGFSMLVISTAGLQVSAADSDWKLRFGLQLNSPTGDFVSAGQTTELDDTTGIFVSVEFRVNDRFGIESGLDQGSYDIDVSQSGFPTLDFGEVDALALTLNGNFHLMPERKFDLYVGPTVGYMFWDDIDDNVFGGTIATEDELAIGANAGIDVPIGESRWSFGGAVRYLATDLAIKGGPDIGVDPIQVKAGLAFNF
jgi:outer membrane protein W